MAGIAMPTLTLRLIIHGRVQGVAYRDSMCEAAHALGVTGWVRNRNDGTVEALLYGEATACSRLLQWAQRGPPAAHVTRVEQVPTGETDRAGFTVGFVRRPTAL
jgi:acylphosphatase